MTNNILSDICGYALDEQQQKVVKDNSRYLLVIAAAGAGKTLTIIGKIRYLIEVEKLKQEDILCISFTNEATNSLKNKLKINYDYDIDVLTFHKLALNILKDQELKITSEEELEDIIRIFLNTEILNYPFLVKCILRYYNILFNKHNYLKKYQKFLKKENYFTLLKTISRFINLAKANHYNPSDLKNFIYQPFRKKDRFLLIVIYALYLEYEKELFSRQTIDFNDMISLAIKHSKNFSLKYKYIIVDEYQDTSYLRYELLNKLCTYLQAKLMVVGDDWQSIYRFNGCSLAIFLNFSQYFKNSNVLNITHTYRNPQNLIDIAGQFINKNPNQLKKELQALKNIVNPIIIIYYKERKNDFTNLIEKLTTQGSLFILGRNNFDLKKYLDLQKFNVDSKGYITSKEKSLNEIRFLTVHKAKGLESDNVIIINLENNKYGFPSQVVEEPILKYLNKQDDYPYAEERRLFYVALTRSKNRVYLYVNKENESIFVKEIKKLIKLNYLR